jgi:GT2 family glycosyltransferase
MVGIAHAPNMKNSLWVMLAAAGRPELLKRTLESIAECNKPANYAGTIVIENSSKCGIEPIVRSFSRQQAFTYLYSKEPNKCIALNLGLAHTDGGFIVFTDDDVRVSRNWLTGYAAAARAAGAKSFFGGPVHIDAEHGLPPEWMRRYYPLTLALPWELDHDDCPTAVPGQAFMGTNWAALGREIIEAGGFDPNLGPGSYYSVGDETDLQRRLEKCGSTPVYIPDPVVWHYLREEYLNPQWLLDRTYRHGLAWGIAQTRGGRPWVGSVVKAGLRRANALVKGAILRLMGGEERRFRAAYMAERWRGRWEGAWQGRKWPEVGGRVATVPEKRRAA